MKIIHSFYKEAELLMNDRRVVLVDGERRIILNVTPDCIYITNDSDNVSRIFTEWMTNNMIYDEIRDAKWFNQITDKCFNDIQKILERYIELYSKSVTIDGDPDIVEAAKFARFQLLKTSENVGCLNQTTVTRTIDGFEVSITVVGDTLQFNIGGIILNHSIDWEYGHGVICTLNMLRADRVPKNIIKYIELIITPNTMTK